jgi:hypothetical protein
MTRGGILLHVILNPSQGLDGGHTSSRAVQLDNLGNLQPTTPAPRTPDIRCHNNLQMGPLISSYGWGLSYLTACDVMHDGWSGA